MRIVSLCPSNTELLAYLKATSFLVGIDNYSDWPKNILSLPRLGPDLSIDMDAVEQLRPDLVLASLSVPGMEKNIEALNKRNLPYVVFNPSGLEDMIEDLLHLGRLIQKETLALEVAQRLRTRIDLHKERATSLTKSPSIYWEWWPKPIFTPGSQNWLTEMSTLVGATNCFESSPLASVQTTWEEVARRDPDYIFMAWVGVKPSKVKKEFMLKRQSIKEMKAFKNDRIHVLPEPLFCRPSPRLFEGLEMIERLLQPGLAPLHN